MWAQQKSNAKKLDEFSIDELAPKKLAKNLGPELNSLALQT